MGTRPTLVYPNSYTVTNQFPLDYKSLFETLAIYESFPEGYKYDGWIGSILDTAYHDTILYPEQEINQVFFQRNGERVGLNSCSVDGKHAFGTMNSASDSISDPVTGTNIVDHINYLYTISKLSTSRAWRDPVVDYVVNPPVSPATGSRYLVGASATGAWTGYDYSIATWNGSSYTFETPSNGWSVCVTNTGYIYSYSSALSKWVNTGNNSANLKQGIFDVNSTKDSFIPYSAKTVDKFYSFNGNTVSNFPTDGDVTKYLGYDGYFSAFGLRSTTLSTGTLYLYGTSGNSVSNYITVDSGGNIVFKDSNTSLTTLSSILGRSAQGAINSIQYKLDSAGNFSGYGILDTANSNIFLQSIVSGDTQIPAFSSVYQGNLVTGVHTGILAYDSNSVVGNIVSGQYTLSQNQGQYTGGIGKSGYLLVNRGLGSFIHETVTGISSVGNYADYAAILGGTDNGLTSDALRSVILGGKNISGTIPDTVYVPRLALCDWTTDSGQDGMIRFHDGIQYYYNSQWNYLSITYTNTNINQNVGGVKSGDTFNNATIQEVLDKVFTAYLEPSFTSFTMLNQNAVVKVGYIVSTSETFTWATSNSANVQSNSISLLDVTGATTLVTGLANDGSESITLPAQVSKDNSGGTYTWRIKGVNTNNTEFTKDFTMTWMLPIYVGASSNASLNASGILALNENLRTSAFGTYAIGDSGATYKYVAIDSNITVNGFEDADTHFPFDMQDPYNLTLVINGDNYSVKVYRSTNLINGAVNITVK